jgi:hypothetical protein
VLGSHLHEKIVEEYTKAKDDHAFFGDEFDQPKKNEPEKLTETVGESLAQKVEEKKMQDVVMSDLKLLGDAVAA